MLALKVLTLLPRGLQVALAKGYVKRLILRTEPLAISLMYLARNLHEKAKDCQ